MDKDSKGSEIMRVKIVESHDLAVCSVENVNIPPKNTLFLFFVCFVLCCWLRSVRRKEKKRIFFMAATVWEFCSLDGEQLRLIESFKVAPATAPSSSSRQSIVDDGRTAPSSSSSSLSSSVGIDDMQQTLVVSESTCRALLSELDCILHTLGEVAALHNDVTGRTNSLMTNCENLLEQQHTLQATVDALKKTLGPFAEIEGVAELLGIPFDAHGLPTSEKGASALAAGATANIDPRAPEFKDVLARLARALLFLRGHDDFRDSERYTRWLEQLQNRATSLVARAMRDLLDGAARSCGELHKQMALDIKAATKAGAGAGAGGKTGGQAVGTAAGGVDINSPLESAPVYSKFRGLGFRMRELSALLLVPQQVTAADDVGLVSGRGGGDASASGGGRWDQDVVAEVKQAYVLLRTELLLPFVKGTCAAALAAYGHSVGQAPADQSPSSAGTSLCAGIRHAYSTLLRVTQLEQQLFDSLFKAKDDEEEDAGDAAKTNGRPSAAAVSTGPQAPEVRSIVESICNATGDILRPLIIRESDVDELCRLINTLAEDVRSQMLALALPRPLLKQLQRGLERTVSDAQERLVYCAETRLRLLVELFEPMPSHLAYPDILEKHAEAAEAHRAGEAERAKAAYLRRQQLQRAQAEATDGDITDVAAAGGLGSGGSGEDAPYVEDVSKTWYPPLKQTLSLLSKLYGVVDMALFEHFAGRAVELCVLALQAGADGVRKTRSVLNGDLFLVRHLLVLREQLIPFEIRLQSVQKVLDFRPSQQALTQFATHGARTMWRFDTANGLLQLAREGLPAVHEREQDAKKDLDAVLKAACVSLRQSSLKMLMGPADAFLAKVSAFVGDIPAAAAAGANNVPLLPADVRSTLKGQAFVRAERVKEMLSGVQEAAVQTAPDLRDIFRLYVENSVARTILLRPVLQEIEAVHRKLECVIASCVDPGQPRRDLEQLLQSIVSSATAELAQ